AARDLMTRLLAREGFRVTTAADGATGLRLARELHPAAITLDVNMPDMDGWQVLTELKSDPEVCDIPVLLLTIRDDIQTGYALGAHDFLTKPIDSRQLVKSLERHMQLAEGPRVVLVVDDDAAVRALLRRTLSDRGFEVDEAADGRAGLTRLAARRPGLVLL